MPFSAATLRLCSRRMFSWDTLRLGCLRKHCMIQCGAEGEASGVEEDGGPRRPRGDRCSSRSLQRARCQTGLQGGRGGRQQQERGRGRQGRAESGWGWDRGKSLLPLCSPAHAGCKITRSRLPAPAQVEGTSFPTVTRQWVFRHHFQGLEESQILFVAPNQCLGLVSLACPQKPGSEGAWLHPFSSVKSCSVMFPLTGSEEGAKNTF